MSLPFSLTAQAFALTYSNIDKQTDQEGNDCVLLPTREDIGCALGEIEFTKQILVAMEDHETGSTHFHAYVQFVKPITVANDTFNVSWNNKILVAHIDGLLTSMDCARWANYIKKEDKEPFYVNVEAEMVMKWLAAPLEPFLDGSGGSGSIN